MKAFYSTPEALETRIAPAAVFVDATSLTVSLSSSGALKIAPKVANTSVEVHLQQLENGDFLITDAAGDDDLEETADFTGNVTGINVALGNGDDLVDVVLLGANGYRGSLAISTALGDDSVTVSEGLLKGPLTITTKGTSDIVVGGSDLDIRGAVSVSQVGGSFTFEEGSIASSLTATGANAFELLGSVRGSASLKATTAASFAVGTLGSSPATTIKGSLTVTGSAGDDSLELANVNVSGAFSASLGAGNNDTSIGSGVRVDGTAKFAGTTGTDEFHFGSLADGGPRFNGAVSVSGGTSGGANIVEVLSGIYAGGLSYSGGTSEDNAIFGSTTTAGPALYGKLTLSLGNGIAANSATIHSGTYGVGAAINGGAADDSFVIGSATTDGPSFFAKVTTSLGLAVTANQAQVLSGLFVGGLSVGGGNADDIVSFGAAATAGPQFYSRVTVSLGNSITTNTLTATSGLFGAGLAVTASAGSDALTFGSALNLRADLSVSAGAGANTVSVGTFSDAIKFTYSGGAGVDKLTLAGAGNGSVMGSVSLGDGDDVLTVAPTAGDFFFTFSVDGGTANDTATVPSGVIGSGFVLKKFETIS